MRIALTLALLAACRPGDEPNPGPATDTAVEASSTDTGSAIGDIQQVRCSDCTSIGGGLLLVDLTGLPWSADLGVPDGAGPLGANGLSGVEWGATLPADFIVPGDEVLEVRISATPANLSPRGGTFTLHGDSPIYATNLMRDQVLDIEDGNSPPTPEQEPFTVPASSGYRVTLFVGHTTPTQLIDAEVTSIALVVDPA